MTGVLEAPLYAEQTLPSGGGDFFQVDVRVWRHVLAMGINHAVALMVLARGSGGDNSTTSWSTDAVERYTGVSRPRAKKAIEDLEAAGVLDVLRGGTKPLRRIRPAHEIPGCAGSRTDLSPEEVKFMSLLPLKEADAERSERKRKMCEQVVRKGHAHWKGDQRNYQLELVPKDVDPEPKPQWVWLPNALIDGAAGETPPLELVRQIHNVGAMRMLAEAYQYQRLEEWGGMNPALAHEWYEREEIGQFGPYRVWRFFLHSRGSIGVGRAQHLEDQPYWVSERKEWNEVFGTPTAHWGYLDLADLGLATWVPCLFEAETPEAELLYPIGHRIDPGYLSNDEIAFAETARATALKMIEHLHLEIADTDVVVAVPAHFKKPHMRGVLRMRYRPHTAAIARWCAASAGLVQIGDKLVAAVQ